MSIPKKGTRKIIVDGEPFIWLIRRQATKTQAESGCGNLHVAVDRAQQRGSVLVIITDRPHPQGLVSKQEVKPVKPSDVAQWIRQAMQLGWPPRAIGNNFSRADCRAVHGKNIMLYAVAQHKALY
jgi:hypothetical protein